MPYYIQSHFASLYVFLAILTHNSLHSGRYVTSSDDSAMTEAIATTEAAITDVGAFKHQPFYQQFSNFVLRTAMDV